MGFRIIITPPEEKEMEEKLARERRARVIALDENHLAGRRYIPKWNRHPYANQIDKQQEQERKSLEHLSNTFPIPESPSRVLSWTFFSMGVAAVIAGAAITCFFGIGLPLLFAGLGVLCGFGGSAIIRKWDNDQYQSDKKMYLIINYSRDAKRDKDGDTIFYLNKVYKRLGLKIRPNGAVLVFNHLDATHQPVYQSVPKTLREAFLWVKQEAAKLECEQRSGIRNSTPTGVLPSQTASPSKAPRKLEIMFKPRQNASQFFGDAKPRLARGISEEPVAHLRP